MNFNISEKTKILVVAPHQDDETIGCGGFLALYGKHCDVLLLTDGRYGISDSSDYKHNIEIRNKEMESAMKLANVNNIFYLNIENLKLKNNKSIVRRFNIKQYDFILVPNRNENHIDHKPVYRIFNMMIFIQGSKACLYEYEVWTPLISPTNTLDISSVIDIKKKMLKEYKSQLSEKNYYDAVLGLNKYRALAYDNDYAEAFYYSKYKPFFGKIYNLLPNSIKKIIIKKVGGK